MLWSDNLPFFLIVEGAMLLDRSGNYDSSAGIWKNFSAKDSRNYVVGIWSGCAVFFIVFV